MANPFCPYCGAQLTGNEQYCPKCGRKINNRKTSILPFIGYGAAILVLALVWILVIIPAIMRRSDDSHSKRKSEPVNNVGSESTEPIKQIDPIDTRAEDVSESMDVEIWSEEEEKWLPEVQNLTLEAGLQELGINRSEVKIDYAFSDYVNRGCIIDAYQLGAKYEFTVSKGRNYTFLIMRKRNGDGSIDYVHEYSFDEDNNCTGGVKTDAAGNYIFGFQYQLNEGGSLIGQVFYTEDGNYDHSWDYRCDRYGRITQTRKYDNSNDELERQEFSYDSSGKIISRKDYKNGTLAYVWSFEDYDENITPLSYHPHIGGNWIFAEIYDASGNLIRYATQSFDEYGAIEEMAIYSYSNDALVYAYEFESGYIS